MELLDLGRRRRARASALVDVSGALARSNELQRAQQVGDHEVHTAVLYAPGLTGLFTATGALTVSGAKLTSQALVSALAPFQSQLPPLMRGYVSAVDSERERLETARCVVHGRASSERVRGPSVNGAPSAADVCDAAWLAEIGGALVRHDGSSKVQPRIDPHNRAMKWDVGGEFASGAKSWIWIDLIATRANKREIRIRANGRLRDDMRRHADATGRMPTDAQWRKGTRTTGRTSTLAVLSLTGTTVDEALTIAKAAADWTAELKRMSQ